MRAHVEPSSGVAPDPAPYESAALLLSYEGKREARRSPLLLSVFRAMLVRTSPKMKKAGTFRCPASRDSLTGIRLRAGLWPILIRERTTAGQRGTDAMRLRI